VLVVASGGIAAYKVPELVRLLVRAGHEVRCALTPAAREFVAPLTLQALSQHPVRSDLLDPGEEGGIGHIELADWPDLVIAAPATANLLARLAHGLADDLVTTVLLASRAPLLVAPAMNVNMWDHPATQANVETLRGRGVELVGPEAGSLACGWEGQGRMADPETIAGRAAIRLGEDSLAGQRVLVTAGGTRESIDAVRAITNRSSGKMGFALASEAARRGAEVVLVCGPCALPTPAGVRRVDVESALDMREAVRSEREDVRSEREDVRSEREDVRSERADASIVIMSAAVADFRPARVSERKIKKEDLAPGAALQLELVANPDILAELCQERGATGGSQPVIVGFAAESHDVVAAARRKLERKGCDLLVANDISRSDAGFDSDENAVFLIEPGGEVEELPLLAKAEVAGRILDRVQKLLGERS